MSPSGAEHREQAERNEALCRNIIDQSPDWSVTIAFYAALHFIGQYAESLAEKVDLSGHTQTTRWIASRKELRRIGPDYSKLMALAHRTRYECPPDTDETRNPDEIRTRVFPRLSSVHRCIDLALKRLDS